MMTTDNHSVLILAADPGWLVVEKPPGLIVQGEGNRNLCYLVQIQIMTDPDLRNRIGCDHGFGIHPVHRLDRETSGVILLACQREIFSHFARQFEHHKVRKRYIALLHGELAQPETETGWKAWEWPLSKEAGGRFHPEGKAGLVPCETRFRVLRRSPHYTLVECDLVTGRKHQIRRHARLAGHAVVGDSRYGTPRSLRFLREETGFIRLALHSFSLRIRLPETGTLRVFQSRAIPAEILSLLEEDRCSVQGE